MLRLVRRDLEPSFFRLRRLEREGYLAEHWSIEEAADLTWAIPSLHTYENLVVERGWPIDRFVRHLRHLLRRTLLKESADGEP